MTCMGRKLWLACNVQRIYCQYMVVTVTTTTSKKGQVTQVEGAVPLPHSAH